MTTYRTGNDWGVTIVREPGDCGCPSDDPRGDIRHDINGCGLAQDAQLVAVVLNQDQALAERICALLNGHAIALAAVDFPHRCPGCGNHFRTAEAAAGCDADHRAHAERIRTKETKP